MSEQGTKIDGRNYSEISPTFLAEPHTRLDALRSQTAIAWDEAQKQHMIVRYGAARRVLQDPALLRERAAANAQSAVARTFDAVPDFVPERKHGAAVLIFKDGEDHKRLRKLIGETFLARVKQARPEVKRIVEEVVGALAPAGQSFDLVQDYAIPVPVRVIASLLGLPDCDHAQVRGWSEDLALGFNPFRTEEEDAKRWRAVRAMLDYFVGRLELAKRAPGANLISDWAALQQRGAALSDKEIVDHSIMMLTAGNLSTTDLIANAALRILRDRVARSALAIGAEGVTAIIEETLRLDPPVTTTDRIAPAALDVEGCPIARGDVMTVSLLAANHDPDTYPTPHCFDAQRPARQHLAFGAGAHICLGAPLARLEAQIALQALFDRFPDLDLLDADVRLRAVPGHLGPERLMVRG